MDFYVNYATICYIPKSTQPTNFSPPNPACAHTRPPDYKDLQIMLFPLDTLETTVTVAEFAKIQVPHSDFIVNDIVVLISVAVKCQVKNEVLFFRFLVPIQQNNISSFVFDLFFNDFTLCRSY